MGKDCFTLALERHDRHTPFFMGMVNPPEGKKIKPLEISVGALPGRRDGCGRHSRMFQNSEFDICEQSLSSYIIAKSRGASFTAAPIFPRRLFSQFCMLSSRDNELNTPSDLIGKNIGILSFQTTLSVMAKGDLQEEYNVNWQDVNWFVQQPEELSLDNGTGASITKIPDNTNAAQMLSENELDAVFLPNPPSSMFMEKNNIKPFFKDTKIECVRYFNKYGYCPIMHLMVFPDEIVGKAPWLPKATVDMFDEATKLTYDYYDDPNYSLILFARQELETQNKLLNQDPWQSGLAANYSNLDRFIKFMVDQNLIPTHIPVESLFHSSVLNT